MAKKEKILTKEQIEFLKFTASNPAIKKNYYLTGGTPLAAFYLEHRYSDDLDFFIEHAEVNLLVIQRIIKEAQKKFKLKGVSYQNYFGLHNFFLKYPGGEELKVDFNYYPFPKIKKREEKYGIEIDSLLDIAVNKIQTIATRTSARDFVDIFFITQETKLSIPDLIKKARTKFDFHIEPIQYGKQFTKVTELKDYPRMIKKLDKKAMQNFFLREAQKLKKEIFK
jgi:predicted nucleotidyltransferase component of viral defense system